MQKRHLYARLSYCAHLQVPCRRCQRAEAGTLSLAQAGLATQHWGWLRLSSSLSWLRLRGFRCGQWPGSWGLGASRASWSCKISGNLEIQRTGSTWNSETRLKFKLQNQTQDQVLAAWVRPLSRALTRIRVGFTVTRCHGAAARPRITEKYVLYRILTDGA